MNYSVNILILLSLIIPKQSWCATLVDDEAGIHRQLNCSCVTPGHERLYHFDTRGEIDAGFNHQNSNLRAVLTEGLGLGRAVMLRAPSLTVKHNYDRQFKYDRWSDYASLEKSTFRLVKRGQNTILCQGALADCVVDVSDGLMESYKSRSHEHVTYQSGPVPDEQNARDGLLIRGPGPRGPGHKRDRVSLARKLPGVNAFVSGYQLILNLRPSRTILDAVPPVIDRLKEQSTTGRIAVIHARRGDKINREHYCPTEMQRATSPAHMAKVLAQAGVPKGSAVYIMSNDHNFDHFMPLRKTYGYHISMSDHYDHLSNLLAGCTNPVQGGRCENYLLFAIENEIMRGVPREYRIPTLPKKDLPHSRHFLMKDFLGPGQCQL